MKLVMMTVAAAMALSAGAPATAQNKGKSAKLPSSWSYALDKDNRPVPKGERVEHADGSWTEEIRRGTCTTTRNGRPGEVRETTKCD